MNNGTRHAFQSVCHDAYDYVDTHFYIDHPVFLGRAWRPPQQFPNENPFKSPTLGGLTIAPLRFFDRPFTVSEWNYCGPGRYRGMGGIATGAEAALQDWSALWRFAWTHGVAGITKPETKGVGSFDIANDPLQRASDMACALLFLRGDVTPLTEEFAVSYDRTLLDAPDPELCETATRKDLAPLGWKVRVGTRFDGSGTQLAATEGDSQRPFPVSIDGASGRFILSTPRTAGGFAEGGPIDASGLRAVISGAPATVWATSLDGKPLERASRILVAHLTDVQPRGALYADEERTTLLDWGAPQPLVMRRGRADIAISVSVDAGAQPPSFTVFALSADGSRRQAIPASCANGRLSFTAKVERDISSATWLYEVERK